MTDPDIDGIVERASNSIAEMLVATFVARQTGTEMSKGRLPVLIRQALTEYDTLMRTRIRDECLKETEKITHEAYVAQGMALAEKNKALKAMTEERDALLVEAEGLVAALSRIDAVWNCITGGNYYKPDMHWFIAESITRWRAAHPKT